MFGVSLSPHVFLSAKQDACNQKLLQEYGGIKGLLRGLKGLGVTYIELRNINPNDDPQEALICARAVWEAGFTLTAARNAEICTSRNCVVGICGR